MKRSEKGVLGIILAATLMIGATAVVSANGGTLVDPNSFASKGKIQVKENETDPDPAIVIDSADLVTLANATNELNTQFTDSLAAAVNNIGSVPKTDRVAAGAQFSDILSAITNSQAIDSSESVYVLPNGTVTDDSTAEGVVETQITGATEANLTAGTAAWVDGQYIVGTGSDNNSYYAEGYSKGAADALNKTNIQYTYHTHEDSCYKTCVVSSSTSTGKGNRGKCPRCGGGGNGELFDMETTYYTHSICGKSLRVSQCYCGGCGIWFGQSASTSDISNHKVIGCGKTTSTIESATITF